MKQLDDMKEVEKVMKTLFETDVRSLEMIYKYWDLMPEVNFDV